MSAKIRIAARLRPRIQGEIEDDTVAVQKEEGSSSVTVIHPRDQSQRFKFPFSSCHDQTSTQEEIYDTDVRPLIDVIYSGVTVTVFAYGVTSSGKTYTMQGTNSEPGIIPRVVQDITERNASLSEVEVSLAVSYMEIYKEDAYDLLVERDNAPKLPIRENESGQVFVANLSTVPLTSMKEFDKIYTSATKRRSTGATNFNRASSRSHAILTLYVQVTDRNAGTVTSGKVNLVDLAGSENNKFTGNDPSRMAESSAINKSLSVLGQVVHALNQGASRIPYRNSKLTRILQDALGGSSIGLLVCNLAPGAKFRQDTWNTLNFATRTKEIENRPVANIREATTFPKASFNFTFQQPLRPGTATSQSSASSRPSISSGRPSLIPSAGVSRLPAPTRGRTSVIGIGSSAGQTNGFQPMALAPPGQMGRRASGPKAAANNVGYAMSEKEIDERISKAVEMEVARRLEEHEKRRQSDASNEQPTKASDETHVPEATTSHEPSPGASTPPEQKQDQTSLPSGVLTPLLRRHEDLDKELKRRLVDLEHKYEQSSKEMQLADVLSPVSRKKTGRAYVALARAHSEKGNLDVALDLYHKAELYVPDNMKLRERILEVEYAVRTGVKLVAEPKKKKNRKDKRDHADTTSEGSIGSSAKHIDTLNCTAANAPLGELTNSSKRHKRELGADNETPPKKQKMDGCESGVSGADVDEDWNPANAPSKKGRHLPAV